MAISVFGFNPIDLRTKSIPLWLSLPKVPKILRKNGSISHAQSRFKYLQAAVSNPNKESTRFFERSFMGGSLFSSSSAACSYEVKTLNLSGEPNLKEKSFDLIKCDLEGSEWDFIIHYSSLLKNSKFLVMEWHSWHSGDGGFPS